MSPPRPLPLNTHPPHSPHHNHSHDAHARRLDPAQYRDSIASPPAPWPEDDPAANDSFAEAFRMFASPPPPSFLDNILNPVPSLQRHPLFGQQPAAADTATRSTFHQPSMASSRPDRLATGYVDLTSDPDPPSDSHRPSARPSPSPGPSAKRLKREDGTAEKRETINPSTKIEEIDLSDDKADLQDVLQKQRQDAVKAQQPPEEKGTTFNTFTCVICMDTPTDITATSCGHVFCHTCLMEALIAGENRSGPNEPKRSQCPVCRKSINRNKPSDVIPLLLMKKGAATQPRKSSHVSTAKVPLQKALLDAVSARMERYAAKQQRSGASSSGRGNATRYRDEI